MGLDVLCDGRPAFVNCTRETLIKGPVGLLPPSATVVEIFETVPPDVEVLAACRNLKDQGYMIALDDYVAGDPRENLAEMADIIKVEMQLTTDEERTRLVRQFAPWHCQMLAEKGRNLPRLCAGARSGVRVFSGIFFRRPEMMTTHDMPANRLNYLRMLQEVSCPELR